VLEKGTNENLTASAKDEWARVHFAVDEDDDDGDVEMVDVVEEHRDTGRRTTRSSTKVCRLCKYLLGRGKLTYAWCRLESNWSLKKRGTILKSK